MSKQFEEDDDFIDVTVDQSERSARRSARESGEKKPERSEASASRKQQSADSSAARLKKKKSHKGRNAFLLILAVVVVFGGVIGGSMLMKNGSSSTAETAAAAEESMTAVAAETAAEAADVVLEQDQNQDIMTLMQNYYAARVAGDTTALATILDASVTISTEELSSESQFVEEYQDITTYVAPGENDGEYAVYTTYSMKFKDIATPAPGLEPAYVRPAADGSLRLIVYSAFDTDIKTFMNSVSASDAVSKLADQVKKEYSEAQESDADLKSFLATLAGTDTSESAAESSAEASGESSSAAESSAASSDITFTETDDIQYATSQVKCRVEPSTEGEDYVLVDAGTWVHVVGTSDEWSKVVLQDGTSGYIFSEFLSPDKPETTAAN